MIREAVASDIDEIVALGERFHAEAHWKDLSAYVADDCRRTVAHMIGADDALILVAEEAGEIAGTVGAMLAPMYFNFGCRTAQEVFWFVRSGFRGIGGELLDALEDAAEQHGCSLVSMVCLESLRPEAVGAFYKRRGYRPAEHTYVKVL